MTILYREPLESGSLPEYSIKNLFCQYISAQVIDLFIFTSWHKNVGPYTRRHRISMAFNAIRDFDFMVRVRIARQIAC